MVLHGYFMEIRNLLLYFDTSKAIKDDGGEYFSIISNILIILWSFLRHFYEFQRDFNFLVFFSGARNSFLKILDILKPFK